MKKERRGIGGILRSLVIPDEMAVTPWGGTRTEWEIEGAHSHVWVGGVRRILVCTAEEVRLCLRCGELVFLGLGLVCLTCKGGAVEISGDISSISYTKRGEMR